MAGSPGYAAPEVLNQQGHSKPVDVWSSGIVAFTLLSGYAPFRATDRQELIEECTRARITFPDRYWKNVSQHAKDFVLALVKPKPEDRPTAQEALRHVVRTSSERR